MNYFMGLQCLGIQEERSQRVLELRGQCAESVTAGAPMLTDKCTVPTTAEDIDHVAVRRRPVTLVRRSTLTRGKVDASYLGVSELLVERVRSYGNSILISSRHGRRDPRTVYLSSAIPLQEISILSPELCRSPRVGALHQRRALVPRYRSARPPADNLSRQLPTCPITAPPAGGGVPWRWRRRG